MDCLRSFIVTINNPYIFSVGGTNVKNWGVVGNYNWIVQENSLSEYLIQGFKRIDLYGVQMVGAVQPTMIVGSGSIVSDYGFQLETIGLNPLVSANVGGTNFWSINPNSNTFTLTKYTNEIKFESPISGVTKIDFQKFIAQGNNGETTNSIYLDLNLTFTFYYKFEGE